MFSLKQTNKTATKDCYELIGYKDIVVHAIFPRAIKRTNDKDFGDWCLNQLNIIAVCTVDGELEEFLWEDITKDIENGFLELVK